MSELLPCPFCGDRPLATNQPWGKQIVCHNCALTMDDVEVWQARARIDAPCPHVCTDKDGTSHCSLAVKESPWVSDDACVRILSETYRLASLKIDCTIESCMREAYRALVAHIPTAKPDDTELTRLKQQVEVLREGIENEGHAASGIDVHNTCGLCKALAAADRIAKGEV